MVLDGLDHGERLTANPVYRPAFAHTDSPRRFAQLIARRVREARVYSEVVPHSMPVAEMLAKDPAAVILSGGNIDPMLMLKSIQAGLSAAGRYMTVRIPLRDRPGELATISRIIADTDANVVRVDHTRVGPELSMGGVHITIDMETRGPEHSAAVLEALRQADYSPLAVP